MVWLGSLTAARSPSRSTADAKRPHFFRCQSSPCTVTTVFPLRSFPCNPTLKIESTSAQSSAGANQKRVILHRMQSSHRQQGEDAACPASNPPRFPEFRHVHTQTRHDNFVRIDRREVFQNMAPVVLRNRHAKPAVLELHVEISTIEQQV